MDSEALKIILDLKEENIILERAIIDAIIMLSNRKEHFTLRVDNQDVRLLMTEVYKILSDFNKIQQPSDES